MHIGDIVVCKYDLQKAIYNKDGDLAFHDQFFVDERDKDNIRLYINSLMLDAIKDMAFLEIVEGLQNFKFCSAFICRDSGRSPEWIWPTKHLVPVPDSVLKKAQLLEVNRWANYPNI